MSHNYIKPPHIVPQVGNQRGTVQSKINSKTRRRKKIVANAILYAWKMHITMAVVIPVLFSIAAEPTQNLPYFTKTLLFQAYNKDVNDPCNNFTTRNVSLPVHPLRLNRHKQERAVSFYTSLHTVHGSYK